MVKEQIIIIGGGAAGYFCAINIAMLNPNLAITILEKTSKTLGKVKISGGGRCNVTHSCFDIDTLAKNYPRGAHFLKKCFYTFNTQHTVEWFAKQGVKLHTEADGRMFPTTNSSQTIIDTLSNLVHQYNIAIITSCTVNKITLHNDAYTLTTNTNHTYTANKLCIATGGYPKIEQYQWLQQLQTNQLLIEQPVPSLFTFNLSNSKELLALMGVSAPNCIVKINGTKLSQQGIVLITHWGLSGPAILKLSAFAAQHIHSTNYNYSISINWVGTYTETALSLHWNSLTSHTNQTVGNHNPLQLPTRLWHYLLQQATITLTSKWQNISKETQNKLIKLLTNQQLAVQGKTTYKEEFVTCGGIQLHQINHTTLQHKQLPNLYFAGEILNIDGITGGFNFQNAWTTGYIAAKAMAELAII